MSYARVRGPMDVDLLHAPGLQSPPMLTPKIAAPLDVENAVSSGGEQSMDSLEPSLRSLKESLASPRLG